MEHEPDAYEDGQLVYHLDKVIEVIIHGANWNEVGKQKCAKYVAEEDLQDNWTPTKDNQGGEEEPSCQEETRVV